MKFIMKKFVGLVIFVVLMILSFPVLSVMADHDYYPEQHLDSTGMDMEAINYFKGVFNEYLGTGDCYIGIISINGYLTVMVFETDSEGKSIHEYEIEGDIRTDMLNSIYGDLSYLRFHYDLETDGNLITGTRKGG